MILKDTLLPPSPETGKEQSTISWEYDFTLSSESSEVGDEKTSAESTIYIPFDKFEPTFRGKPQKDVQGLATGSIKRFSIMNRSFFATQEGSFSLYIKSISAYRKKRSTVESFLKSKAGPPLVLAVGTLALMRGIMWGIDLLRPS